MWRRKSTHFFEHLEKSTIVGAIQDAEKRSLGQIRVHVHHGRSRDPLADARRVFARLGMQKTAGRTGCLVFIAPADRVFAVIGDEGIHEKVGEGFWTEARDDAAARFAENQFTEGIVAAVAKIGDELARHFPRTGEAAKTNELPDDVTED